MSVSVCWQAKDKDYLDGACSFYVEKLKAVFGEPPWEFRGSSDTATLDVIAKVMEEDNGVNTFWIDLIRAIESHPAGIRVWLEY